MAASIYATPPPDLSSEDTALSDASNSSHLSNTSSQHSNSKHSTSREGANNNGSGERRASSSGGSVGGGGRERDRDEARLGGSSKKHHSHHHHNNHHNHHHNKRSIADVLMGHNQALMAQAFTSSSSSALLDALQFDQSKKRRKQTTPIRLAALNLSGKIGSAGGDQNMDEQQQQEPLDGAQHENNNGNVKEELMHQQEDEHETMQNEDYEDKLTKIFLPKLVGQLNPFELLQRNISPLENFQQNSSSKPKSPSHQGENEGGKNETQQLQQREEEQQQQQQHDTMTNYNQIFCKECGENFDSDLRLRFHIMQEHSPCMQQSHSDGGKMNSAEEQHTLDMLSSVKVKLERTDDDEMTSPMQDNRASSQKPGEPWMSAMPALGFPFPPDAATAAAFSSGYLSQLPLLGVPSGFPSVDGLTRPPLRIFNPEAYCDLCNKEFCNKYFLKTHKANKHGIYDPTCTSTDSGMTNASSMGAMSQVFHLQLQQQQQQQLEQAAQFQAAQQQQQMQQQQQQLQSQQIAPPAPMIPCDVCSKKFTNIFAMKRHRTKAHEVPPPINTSSINPPNLTTTISVTSSTTTTASSSSPLEMKYDTATAVESTAPTSHHPGNSISNDKDNTHMPEKDTSVSLSGNLPLPEGFREDFSVEQEDVSFTPQPRKLSPSSQQQARESNFSFDKLKRLGVLNPEAFCDLCCKEYCNKYFLRTHKWKRHGIFVPPDDAKDDIKMQWPFFAMQTTPLNLMMANEKLKLSVLEGEKDPAKRLKFDIDIKALNGQSMEKNNGLSPSSGEPTNDQMTAQQQHQSDSEAVGLNLQKLQSMIMQLNDLNCKRPVACNFCGKEMENQYVLHAHIATEHSMMDNNNGGNPPPFMGIKLSPASSPASSAMPGMSGSEVCKQCDREFSNLFELKQHIAEAHPLTGGLSNNSPLRDGFVTPERPINTNSSGPSTPGVGGQIDRARAPYTITPTSSYCEICNKELCNKYFMKTHMQRMHGIEIENGAQIGGVVCNICNKELCSKYFLRVHKHNTHGIVDEGSPLPQSRQSNGMDMPQDQADMVNSSFPGGGDASIKAELAGVDFNTRYFTHYTEVCPLCSRRFRSAKWLRAHLMSDHGPTGVDKLREMEIQLGATFSKPTSPTLKIPNGNALPQQNPLNNINSNLLVKNPFPGLFGAENPLQSPRFKEYQCSLCSFSTPYYAFLFIHERSHSILSGGGGTPSGAPSSVPSASPPETPIKSETAVSIAKEITSIADVSGHNQTSSTTTNKVAVSSSSSSSASSGGTPTTTPASTPVPQTPQETAKRDIPVATTTTTPVTTMAECPAALPATSLPTSTITATASVTSSTSSTSSLPFPATSHQTSSYNFDVNILQEIAKKSNRPVAYAMPQDPSNGPASELMQSFYVQENPTSTEGNDNDNNGSNRFVPALIYLPVRERISGPITVSFTLTPA